MFERFTEKAIKVIMLAQEEARRLGYNFVGTEQILLGLIGEGTGIAAKTLKAAGVNLARARKEVEEIIGRGTGFVAVEIPFTPRAKRLLEISWAESRRLGHNYIGTEHLLLGLMGERDDKRESEGVGVRVLEKFAVDFADLREKTLTAIKEANVNQPSLDDRRSALASSQPAGDDGGASAKNPSHAPAAPPVFARPRSTFSKFTEKSIKVVMLAQEESRRLGHNFVGTEQILLGLIGEGTGIAAKTLKSLGVNLKDARMQTEKIIGRGSGFVAVEIPYTPRAKRVLDFSWDEARRLGHSYVGTEHLLLGLVQEGEGVAARVLENLGVDLRKVRGHVIRLLDETGRQNTTAGANLANATIERTARLDATATSGGQPTTPMLDQYCINLTQAAQDNKWEAIVGRKQETERIIQILGRYAKNNVILVGEAGVGKTEIARGLATAIADGDVPEMLLEQRMLMLNLGSLAAESNSQSELEDRFKKIMTEVGKTSNLLFVIDEFQMLWQEANLYKESPLARIFKKALSNENCLFIGITNIDVYRQRIEHDAILKNYCQPVIINPMSVQETAEILKRLKERYEQHHNVSITDEAIEQAVILSDEKISERCLPDKAIDLIDEACSWVKLKSTNLPRELTEVKRQLQKIRIEKEQLIRHQDFQKAAVMRQQEAELSEKILEMESAWQEKREKSVVNIEAVEHVLNSWLGR